jgi:hypothetical protein
VNRVRHSLILAATNHAYYADCSMSKLADRLEEFASPLLDDFTFLTPIVEMMIKEDVSRHVGRLGQAASP